MDLMKEILLFSKHNFKILVKWSNWLINLVKLIFKIKKFSYYLKKNIIIVIILKL